MELPHSKVGFTHPFQKVRGLPMAPEISKVYQLSSPPPISTGGIALPFGLEIPDGWELSLSLPYRVFEWALLTAAYMTFLFFSILISCLSDGPSSFECVCVQCMCVYNWTRVKPDHMAYQSSCFQWLLISLLMHYLLLLQFISPWTSSLNLFPRSLRDISV